MVPHPGENRNPLTIYTAAAIAVEPLCFMHYGLDPQRVVAAARRRRRALIIVHVPAPPSKRQPDSTTQLDCDYILR